MKLKFFVLLLLSLYIVNCTLTIEAQATVRYVSKTGSSTPPYTSWLTAADSIQKCINICSFGDTVYVANGEYQELVRMIAGLSLIGAGMDSCIVDTRDFSLTGTQSSVEMADSCKISGFQIIVSHTYGGFGINNASSFGKISFNKISHSNIGIENRFSNVLVENNILINNIVGVDLDNSNSIAKNNVFSSSYPGNYGVSISAISFSYYPVIDSNLIIVSGSEDVISTGIGISINSRPIITNNKIILNGRFAIAYSGGGSDTVKMFNNIIIAEKGYKGFNNSIVPTLQYNNYLTGNFLDPQQGFYSCAIVAWDLNAVKNNVVTNSKRAINIVESGPIVQFNDTWNNEVDYASIIPDSTNISVDPMIVNEDSTRGELDFHLQKYSPLIDAGDPNILDRDGSRSDIGLYGGPYGETYTYNDIAPRPPHNVTAAIEDGLIKITWNKNTEADFSHYRVYRDTVSILIYDSTRIVGVTSDSVFYDNLPPSNLEKRYYYLITAFDNQGNQSAPSEEINVLMTGLSEHPPIGFDGFALLSNYPNPFNPSTIIPYRLKTAGYVKLYIYDIKGELIKTLVNQWQDKGYYEVVFQPNKMERDKVSFFEAPMGKTYSDIATGVYIYHIMVRSEGDIPVFSGIGKMILLK